MSIDWAHKYFFYWPAKTLEEAQQAFDCWVDSDWQPKDLDKIVKYLDDAPKFFRLGAPDGYCFICGVNVGDRSEHHSDGVWLWPGDLSHYILHHNVKLPDAFVEHIRSMNYQLPKPEDVNWETLDWPKYNA